MGQNGQIPPFSEICNKKTLFRNYIGKYHFLWYLSFLNSSSQKFCHRGTAEVEIGQLKKIMWYSSTMQHNTRVHQAHVPFYDKMLFFFFFFFNFYGTQAHQARVPCKLFCFFLSTNKHKHKMMFILFIQYSSSPSSSTLEIKQTPFYVYVYFLIIPKKKKKKFTRYSSLVSSSTVEK